MPSWLKILRVLLSLWLLLQVCTDPVVHSADKTPATVLVKDSLTAPRQEVTVEAKVVTKGLLRHTPLGGEPVELLVNGATAATSMTGGDGRAMLSFAPPVKSIMPVRVRVGNSPRVTPAEGEANVIVWERRTPVLVVELSALLKASGGDGLIPGLSSGVQPDAEAMPDAADALAKLSQFYYGIIYVTAVPTGADAFVISADTRTWLATHMFPAGFVLTIPAGADALGAKLDELHEAGWKMIKTGIGHSKAFVETFLRRRLEAIMVIDPASGDAPRKAKLAKDWKEVRKKL
ncbi:MAG TPA: hypothetical protein VL261_06530 [Nitrospira sp.]|jgi:hypothetical protein|nr:hypothetical protein [Nitrospira sp.]